jgi:hypothetical protein
MGNGAKSIALGLALILCGGTAATAQAGRAEISILGTAEPAKAKIINEMMNRGYTIFSDSPNLIAFDKLADNLGAMFLFGTGYGGAPHSRVSYSIVQIGGSTRIIADVAMLGNAGTAFERRTDLNFGNERAAAQNILDMAASNSGTDRAETAGGHGTRFIVVNGRLVDPNDQPGSNSGAPGLVRDKAGDRSISPSTQQRLDANAAGNSATRP